MIEALSAGVRGEVMPMPAEVLLFTASNVMPSLFFRASMDKVYTTFTNLVAQGRNLPVEKVLDIAGGRVWSGDNALGIGLIDTYGGLKTAIAIAADKAGLGDNFRVTEVIEQPTGFAAFISSLNVGIREAMTRSELGVMMKEYKQVQEATSQQGIVMYYPFKLELR
jgi:protease-4